MTGRNRRWNHNIHYYPVLLDALPDRCTWALDIGSGEGILATELRQSVPDVSAIDIDRPSIELARRKDPAADIQYLLGDFLAFPFEPASFDFSLRRSAPPHECDCGAEIRSQRIRPQARIRRRLFWRWRSRLISSAKRSPRS